MTCEEQLTKFLKQTIQNRMWIGDGTLNVYVRKGHHVLGGEMLETLDIANIEAEPKGKGRFTTFLQFAENTAKPLKLTILVEAILEPRLIPFLRKKGYLKDKNIPENLYKLPRS